MPESEPRGERVNFLDILATALSRVVDDFYNPVVVRVTDCCVAIARDLDTTGVASASCSGHLADTANHLVVKFRHRRRDRV